MKPMGAITRLIVHHSASDPRSTTVSRIREWHQDKGWDDIGYHRVIEGDGTLRVARGLEWQGAHGGPQGNAHSIGLCVVGDNTKAHWRWNPDQEATLVEFIEACRNVWPGIEVLGHRDVRETECPGLELADWMAEKGI